ncbi:AIR synthase related protein, partial [Deinococcus sp.]|uniref:AIR synthase related protein n=1 Tax=Deinococcus sp. TaxID=47478 RepID=UPI00391B9378
MRWPIDRIQRLLQATKGPLGELIGALRGDDPGALGGFGYVGDDGVPLHGTDVIAACDAILPAMVERDPEWAGWCAVLVNMNDLSAMGAKPVGLLDSVAAPTASFARRILGGLRSGADAWGVPILGGHTQLGVASSLSVTALGRTKRPVPGGGGRAGDDLSLTADLRGRWRRGFEGKQWDTTSARTGAELRELGACRIVADRSAIPPLDALNPTDLHLSWTVDLTTSQPRSAIDDVFIFVMDEMELAVSEVTHEPRAGQPSVTAEKALPEQAEHAAPVAGRPVPANVPAIVDAKAAKAAENVRVPAERLDELMDRVGELVIAQSRLSQLAGGSGDLQLRAVSEDVERLSG